MRAIWIGQLLQDLRHGVRLLRRQWRFSALVVFTLAVGIGMNTAVFSVVDTVLLKPLPYASSERLVWLADHDPNIQRDFVRLPDFTAWHQHARSYSAMAAYGYLEAALGTARGASQVTGVYIAGDFWNITGARPALGRLFADNERDCLVVTWRVFQRELGGDPRILDAPVFVNGRAARITGVLPRDFRFRFPTAWISREVEPVDAYFSVPPPGEGMAQSLWAVAVLAPGVRVEQAQAELDSLEKHLVEEGGQAPMTRIRVEPLHEKLAGSSRRALLVLFAAATFVLLITCANVASLLLARSTTRQKEMAIRAALGAGRMRMMRQLLAESVLLALLGGGAGVLLAHGSLGLLVGISPHAIPRLAETTIDVRVLAFTLLSSLLTGVLFGIAPALSAWRTNLQDALKDRATSGGSRLRVRRLLVAVELALAIVLLTGAGLMIKSFARMIERPAGFAPEKVMLMKVRFAGRSYGTKEAQGAYYRELRQRIEGAAGVESAGISTWYWLRGPALPPGVSSSLSQSQVVKLNGVTQGYLNAVGMTLLKGRWLTEADAGAALVNESMARRTFGDADPIGRQLAIRRPVVVVGVLADVKYTKLDAEATPEIFVPHERIGVEYGAQIAVRAAADPIALAPALRKLVSQIDPSQPVFDVETLDQALAESIAPRRFSLLLLGSFAASALALAVLGVYGVVAYSVSERRREIAVRMAVGARRSEVVAMVLRQALPITLIGIASGLGAAFGLTPLMAALLYGVNATDPQVFAVVAALLGATVAAACVHPALRAASIDPAVALRSE